MVDTVCMTSTTTTTYTPDSGIDSGFAIEPLKRLDRWLKACDKWYGLCDALAAARGTDQEPAALEAWQKGIKRMPGKQSKYRAYDYGNQINRYLDLGMPRPQTRADLREISDAAHRVLGS